MVALALSLLVFLVYLRPQEVVPALRGLPLFHTTAALIGLALVAGRIRRARGWPPVLALVLAFWGWCAVSRLAHASFDGALEVLTGPMLVNVIFTVLIGLAAVPPAVFRRLAGAMVVVAIALSALAWAQSRGPLQCIHITNPGEWDGIPDGRVCETADQCPPLPAAYLRTPDPSYECEHVGPFGTTTVERRARWVGILHDPNDLALALSLLVPFALFRLGGRGFVERLTGLAGLAAVLVAVVVTRSRGGVLALGGTLLAYAWQRRKIKAVVGAVLAFLPIVAFGGRSGGTADESSYRRFEAWHRGVELVRMWPGFGAGHRQFTQHHELTAHNSFVLAAAELGLFGLGLFLLILGFAVSAVRAARTAAISEETRRLGDALLASTVGYGLGAMFLSVPYHAALYVLLGLHAAWWGRARAEDPTFAPRPNARQFAVCLAAGVVLLGMVWVFAAYKL